MTVNTGSALSVLIIDDDEVDRERVRRALQRMVPPPTLTQTDSIAGAELELAKAPFDCVILDYLLPEGRCSEFLPHLQMRGQNAAFIVLTGQGDEGVAVELMKAGAADYMSKDNFEPTRLCRAIKYAVALRRAEDHAAASESLRSQHAERLRRFVDRVPEIMAARSFDQLAKVSVTIALDVFEAQEARVELRDVATDSVAAASTDDTALERWVHAALISDTAFACEGALLAIALRARDGSARGLVAMKTDAPSVEHLLRQFAVTVAICSDNLMLYDAASRAIRTRDDVMAVVSHDLRAPLNNIRLGANLLHDSSAADASSILERVERNVTHMARLVDDLVDMVRLEGRKLTVAMSRESVASLLQTAATLVAEQARTGNIELLVRPCASAQLSVMADRDRVVQILSNLLSNAIKFTPSGGTIELRADEASSMVRFEVRDTGGGIPEQERAQVFSRFWQSDPKRRRGLGLGLYIAKGLVLAHGGQLWFESEVGAGSRFFFTLKRADGGDEARDCQPQTDRSG